MRGCPVAAVHHAPRHGLDVLAGVVMVGVFGTMAADVLHVRFGVSYAVSSGLYAVVLGVVFVSWEKTEKTLSIHSIDTPVARPSTGRPSSRPSPWAQRPET